MWTGYAAAVGGMVVYGVASVLQAYAARRATGPRVVVDPFYLAGLVGDGVAFVLSVVALATLPLFVVQSLLAGSLAVTVLLALPVLHLRPTRRDVVAVGVVTVGLLLVSASAAAESTRTPPAWFSTVMVVVAGVVVVASVLLYSRGTSVAVAVCAGLGFSLAALGARALHLGEGHWHELPGEPMTWVVVVGGGLGALMYARSLERGDVGPATAALWVVEVVVPGAVGVAALGDAVRPGWEAAAVMGVIAAVAGCVVLAHSPAQA